jgi:hypothetical protein
MKIIVLTDMYFYLSYVTLVLFYGILCISPN